MNPRRRRVSAADIERKLLATLRKRGDSGIELGLERQRLVGAVQMMFGYVLDAPESFNTRVLEVVDALCASGRAVERDGRLRPAPKSGKAGAS